MKSRTRSSTSPSPDPGAKPRTAVEPGKGSPGTDSAAASRLPFIEYSAKGLFIRVRLQPRSSKNTIDGVQDGALRLRLTAPPVEGSANKALIEFLSDIIGIRKSSLSIDSGLKSRDKRVRVEDSNAEEIERAFTEALK